jgi:hypothetical protein
MRWRCVNQVAVSSLLNAGLWIIIRLPSSGIGARPRAGRPARP